MNTSTVKYQKIDTSTYLSSNSTNIIVPVRYQPAANMPRASNNTTTSVHIRYQPFDTKIPRANNNNIYGIIIQSNNIDSASKNNIIKSNDIN